MEMDQLLLLPWEQYPAYDFVNIDHELNLLPVEEKDLHKLSPQDLPASGRAAHDLSGTPI